MDSILELSFRYPFRAKKDRTRTVCIRHLEKCVISVRLRSDYSAVAEIIAQVSHIFSTQTRQAARDRNRDPNHVRFVKCDTPLRCVVAAPPAYRHDKAGQRTRRSAGLPSDTRDMNRSINDTHESISATSMFATTSRLNCESPDSTGLKPAPTTPFLTKYLPLQDLWQPDAGPELSDAPLPGLGRYPR